MSKVQVKFQRVCILFPKWGIITTTQPEWQIRKEGYPLEIQRLSYQTEMITSLQQALDTSLLQKTMSQDAQSVDALLKMMESSVAPHLGQNIDIRL
ncbi:MAG: putative motility protein [Clostridiales bacterium]|jgi:hypothetical protein|nr:putative motility protein [Clostridiales bacterium]